jgi:hypothetical protein
MSRGRRHEDGGEHADGARAASKEACKHGKASQDRVFEARTLLQQLEILQTARPLSMI